MFGRPVRQVFAALLVPIPRLSQAGCPRVARAGAARSVSPIGRNINDLFKDEQYRLIKKRFAANIIRWLRVFEPPRFAAFLSNEGIPSQRETLP